MYGYLKLLFIGCSFILLNACSSVDVNDYKTNKPTLNITEFFNGSLNAHGILKDRSGKVTRYFNATINASWNNGVGTLDEQFVFDDGEKQTRIWQLRPDGKGSYIGTANDVVGESTLRTSGNALFLNYVLRVPYRGQTLDLNIDDRMYLVSDKILINESKMSKWGFDVGEINLVITKP